MVKSELNELASFALVASERNFTRAAARLGLTQSALSHSVRGLEQKLGVQLLARTSRTVAPTAAGAALLRQLSPALEQIEGALAEVKKLRERPAGRVRLVMSKNAVPMVLLPKLAAFSQAYPEITLDVVTVSGPVDLVAGGYDAGIQLGEFIQRDMIAVRVSKDTSLAVVGSPAYFKSHSVPKRPQDLREHPCIGVRGTESVYRWEFQKGKKSVALHVDGPLVIDDPGMILQAALNGVGLGLGFEQQVEEHIAHRRLIRVLEDWCPPFPGFFMYYPSRRNQPAALAALIAALRLS
jgi:DNA-binding transcriptional LysR family regulator